MPVPVPLIFMPVYDRGRLSKDQKSSVRSHVTRVQHSRSSKTKVSEQVQSGTSQPRVYRSKKQICRLVSERSSSTEESDTSTKTWEKVETTPPTEESCASIRRSSCHSQVAIKDSPQTAIGAPRQDPFWTYPVKYESSLPAIFADYIENVAVEIPDLDTTSYQGLLRKRWFPLAMEEPSTMYAVLLMAASHFCALNPQSSDKLKLLSLKSKAISEINKALQNPKRATSDAVIGAVVKMAAYEACFGTTATFTVHMQGLAQMIRARGGLGALGQDGLLELMVVWIDLNAAYLCGTEGFFGNLEFPSFADTERPDPYHFAGIS